VHTSANAPVPALTSLRWVSPWRRKYSVVLGVSASVAEDGIHVAAATAKAATVQRVANLERLNMITLH
jgi:hypothetical protein